MKYSLLLLLSVYLMACGNTQGQDQTAKKADGVLVYKAQRKMHLLYQGEIISSYTIALGDNPIGHKQQEGDERTPEGKYVLDWRNSKSAYHKSIHISYPNAADKASAKARGVSPGGDIMIHGMSKKQSWMGGWHTLKDWTNGCIAITNEEMDEVWTLVKIGTPIEIFP